MAPEHKSGDAGNSDNDREKRKVLPLSEWWVEYNERETTFNNLLQYIVTIVLLLL